MTHFGVCREPGELYCTGLLAGESQHIVGLPRIAGRWRWQLQSGQPQDVSRQLLYSRLTQLSYCRRGRHTERDRWIRCWQVEGCFISPLGWSASSWFFLSEYTWHIRGEILTMQFQPGSCFWLVRQEGLWSLKCWTLRMQWANQVVLHMGRYCPRTWNFTATFIVLAVNTTASAEISDRQENVSSLVSLLSSMSHKGFERNQSKISERCRSFWCTCRSYLIFAAGLRGTPTCTAVICDSASVLYLRGPGWANFK